MNANFIAQMQVLLVSSGIRFVLAIVILVFGWMAATWTKRWILAGLAHLPIDLTLKPLIASLVRYGILILTLILVLGQFGVQTTSLIAVMGAAGLAIGLAMQGTLSNVAAGVMLLVLRPFRVGQFVEIGGQQGTVREIGLFTTLLTTRDLVYISIPNSSVFSGVTSNFTREPVRRINFNVTVDLANDLAKVEKIIEAALAASAFTLKSPPPWSGVSALQEYSALMFARCFIHSGDYWKALPALQREVKAALDKDGILYAANRQAVAVRNEPLSAVNTQTHEEEPPAGRPARLGQTG